MKLLQKRNQKEAEERKLKVNINFFLKYRRWIGLTVYPFFMLFAFLTANGQQLQDPRLTSLLQLDFTTSAETTQSINEPLDLYYQNLKDILQVILLEDPDVYESLEANRELRLEELDRFKNNDDPWYGFVKAEIKLQWAFVNFKFGNDWNTFWGLRSAARSIDRNQKDYPDFDPNKRTLGVLNIIFGNVPSKNQWLMNLFGLKGDVFTGIDQLENIDREYSSIILEADLILSMIQAFLLEDYKAADRQSATDQPTEGSPLLNYVKAIVQLKIHHALAARRLLESGEQKLPFHDYLIAETYFQAQSYQKAISHYQKFLGTFKGVSYVKDAYLKIGMSYGLLEDIDEYDRYLILATKNGSTQSEIDKNAAKIIKDLPNQRPIALKIRYAIDGGFYDLAHQLIEQYESEKITKYERLELTYRKARINHLSGQTQKALGLYRLVIENADLISETYYGPNSFLQAGYLMREIGNNESALMYFEEVLKLKKHPYKVSLDSKAKIAIQRLDR